MPDRAVSRPTRVHLLNTVRCRSPTVSPRPTVTWPRSGAARESAPAPIRDPDPGYERSRLLDPTQTGMSRWSRLEMAPVRHPAPRPLYVSHHYVAKLLSENEIHPHQKCTINAQPGSAVRREGRRLHPAVSTSRPAARWCASIDEKTLDPTAGSDPAGPADHPSTSTEKRTHEYVRHAPRTCSLP